MHRLFLYPMICAILSQAPLVMAQEWPTEPGLADEYSLLDALTAEPSDPRAELERLRPVVRELLARPRRVDDRVPGLPRVEPDFKSSAYERYLSGLGDRGKGAIPLIEEFLNEPPLRPAFADRVRLALETEVRFLTQQGRIHYVSLGRYSDTEELKANIEKLRVVIARRSRPDCQRSRLAAGLDEFVREVASCRSDSLRALTLQGLREAYSTEKFVAAVAALEALGPVEDAFAVLDLLDRWRWKRIPSPSLNPLFADALGPFVPALSREDSPGFEILWALELTDSIPRYWDGFATFLHARKDDAAMRYNVSRAWSDLYDVSRAEPRFLKSEAVRKSVVELGRGFLERKDAYRMETLAWIASAQTAPLDPELTGLLFKVADQTEIPYARLQAIRLLNERLRISSSPAGGAYDIQAEKARFLATHLPTRVETERRTFVTGDRLAEPRIRELDRMFDEEERVFLGLLGIAPDPSGPKLVVKLTNDPDDYAILMDLFEGLSSNNGGMYLPRGGVPTFFSYERTRSQSIYTLEELARHEYVHFLQHHYLAPGSRDWDWNAMPHWYTEALADLLVGFQPDGSILPREVHLRSIRNDERRLSLEEILTSEDDADFSEYRYGALFLHFLLNRKPELFKALSGAIRSRTYAYRGSGDNFFTRSGFPLEGLNAEYQAYLDELLKRI